MGKKAQAFERVIVFDHDLEFSPSVLSFFDTSVRVLNQDLSLFAASAWNELGLPHLVGKQDRMARDSYFSGVAWMIHKADWAALDADWPSDDVLREHGWVHWVNDKAEAGGSHGGLPPDVALRWSVEGWDDAKRRDVAVPQVSRVKRSGGGAYDPEEAPLQQFSERVELASSQPDATAFGDLSYMKEEAYEAEVRAKIRLAKLLPSMSVPPTAPTTVHKVAWVIAYEPQQYAAVAKRLQIPERPMGQFKGATVLTRKDSSVSLPARVLLLPPCLPSDLSRPPGNDAFSSLRDAAVLLLSRSSYSSTSPRPSPPASCQTSGRISKSAANESCAGTARYSLHAVEPHRLSSSSHPRLRPTPCTLLPLLPQLAQDRARAGLPRAEDATQGVEIEIRARLILFLTQSFWG